MSSFGTTVKAFAYLHIAAKCNIFVDLKENSTLTCSYLVFLRPCTFRVSSCLHLLYTCSKVSVVDWRDRTQSQTNQPRNTDLVKDMMFCESDLKAAKTFLVVLMVTESNFHHRGTIS